MYDYDELWHERTPVADIDGLDIIVPAWINQDITPYDITGICEGGDIDCDALKTMTDHGDEVLEYIVSAFELHPPETANGRDLQSAAKSAIGQPNTYSDSMANWYLENAILTWAYDPGIKLRDPNVAQSLYDANDERDSRENDLGELAELLIPKIKAEIDDNGTPPEKKARRETDLTELMEIVYIVDIDTDYDADTVRVGPMPDKQVSAVLDADKTFSGPHISRDFLGYADELIKYHTYLNSANRGQ